MSLGKNDIASPPRPARDKVSVELAIRSQSLQTRTAAAMAYHDRVVRKCVLKAISLFVARLFDTRVVEQSQDNTSKQTSSKTSRSISVLCEVSLLVYLIDSIMTTPAESTLLGRPPKKPQPVPFGGGEVEEEDVHRPSKELLMNDSDNNNNHRTSVTSDCSRQSLKRDIRRFRASLTPQEHTFLEELCIHGNEIEVQLAHEKLLDDSVFFRIQIEDELEQQQQQQEKSTDDDDGEDKDKDAEGWSSQTIRVGQEISQSLREEELSDSENGARDSLRSTMFPFNMSANSKDRSSPVILSNAGSQSSAPSMGSDRRRQLLEERKKNFWFGKMWKASESGIGLSKQASKRSLVSRRNSSSALSSSTTSAGSATRKHLQLRNRNNEIFRSNRYLMNDIRSDNNRRGSSGSRVSFASVGPLGKAQRATSVTMSPVKAPKPQLRRMMSEGSRKSVTFGELPLSRRESAVSEAGEGGPREGPVRMNSMSSVPSIHLAHPIRSPSLTSQSSIPSLHHAHHIHGSFSSFRSSGTTQASALSSSTIEFDGTQDPALLLDPSQDEKKSETPYDSFIPPDVVDTSDMEPECKPAALKMKDASENNYQGVGVEVSAENPDKDLAEPAFRRPVLIRDASVNLYKGQGVEIADLADAASLSQRESMKDIPIQMARRMDSLVSFGELTAGDSCSLRRCDSFDETMSYGRVSSIFRRTIRRTLSDDDLTGIFLGGSRFLLRETSSVKERKPDSDEDSWLMDDESEMDYYDTWKVIEDEYENGYGGGGTLPFLILGTSADDIDAHPHVLSPPLMESLQAFLPMSKYRENFWMKYSLVRDGASMHTFLQFARGAKYSFLAIETVDGEVFGCFTTEPWRKNWNFFGGTESFLWRMRGTRGEKCHSIIDQAQKESEIDVYPYTGENNCIQLCTQEKMAVGGGSLTPSSSADMNIPDVESPVKEHEWGFGLTLDHDLLEGTSSPCVTFGSPSLSRKHSDGSRFEIINLELWTLTPCFTLEDAEKMELGKLFLESHSSN